MLRLRRPALVDPAALAAAQLWYPAVGAALGGALAVLDWLLRSHFPPLTEAALLVILLEASSGLLHLDGLADSADGLLGLATPERRLEIMRDSRAGAFGIAAVAMYLLLVWSAIAELRPELRASVLLLLPAAGRGALVLVSASFPYARPSGLGTGFYNAARGAPGVVALVTLLGFSVSLLGPAGLLPLSAALMVALALSVFARVRLGGVTGDVIGAGCEFAQAGFLLAAVAWQSAHWFRPWW